MQILQTHRNVPQAARGAVVALGNFDGVHRGHKALLAAARARARDEKRPFAIIVFEPYPFEFFRPSAEPQRLTSFASKARIVEGLGADYLIVLAFDAALAAMSAQDFVLDVLVRDLGVAHVVVGEDFRFGKGRSGDATVLAYMGEMEGFGVTVYPPLVADAQDKISSSRIRAALKEGRPDEAARLLGHWWSVEGVVIHGDKRGRTLGYPTANLTLEGLLQPAFGIYAVRVEVGGDRYDGVANFGRRPMFELATPLFEVYLFDFAGDIYGQTLRAELVAYLRPEARFDTLDALKAQLALDCDEARKILAAAGQAPARTP